jgi:hypothetical protein
MEDKSKKTNPPVATGGFVVEKLVSQILFHLAVALCEGGFARCLKLGLLDNHFSR